MVANASAAKGSSPSLIDVLGVPGIGASVLSHLQKTNREALRRTCSATCALEDVLIAERLARKGLMPQQLQLAGYSDSSSAAMTALLATVHQQFFARLQCMVLSGRLSGDTLRAVAKALPLLEDLTISQGRNGHNIKLLAATPLPSLRSLEISSMDLSNAQFLTGYTQLGQLSLGYTSDMKGISALAQLTGLTSLELYAMPGERPHRQFSPTEQSELGSLLAALKQLRSLNTTYMPPGPMTQAVSQLTALTQVILPMQDLVGNPGPLILPSALRLCLGNIPLTPKHLAEINAPQLQYLFARSALGPHDLDSVKRLCSGIFKAASSLYFDLQNRWSKEDTVTLMTVLRQSWQPSAQALSQAEQYSVEQRRSLLSVGQVCGSSSTQGWGLALVLAHCSRQCLSQVPIGLKRLDLSCCDLDPDSLDPLAHVASLRELVLFGCSGVTVASLELLFSTSVQGCLLLVHVSGSPYKLPAEACLEMRARVVAQRGSRDTPALKTAARPQ